MKHVEQKKWEVYEQSSRNALRTVVSHFGLDKVAGKQRLPGKSGTVWEIDAKVQRSSDGKFFIVECRRYPEDRLKQEAIAGLAYKMKDVGASGALVVTPKGLQKGAAKIAAFEKIHLIKVSSESTIDRFMWEFRNIVGHGITEHVSASFALAYLQVLKVDPCNGQDGPANGSQPIRPEKNPPSSAGGSSR
jgi:Restriction endonuclease